MSVTVADDITMEEYLSFVVRPDEGPLIGYYSAQHEAAMRPLLERVRGLWSMRSSSCKSRVS